MSAFSSSGRARSVEPPIRSRCPITASRFTSALKPAPTPITTIRPRRFIARRFASRSGAADELEQHVERPALGAVLRVQDLVRAEPGDGSRNSRVAHRRGDVGARGRRELHGRRADAAGRAADQHALAHPQARLAEERVVRGREDLREAAGGRALHRVGDRHRLPLVHDAELRLAAAADDRHDAVADSAKRVAPGPVAATTSPASSSPGMSAGEPGGAG